MVWNDGIYREVYTSNALNEYLKSRVALLRKDRRVNTPHSTVALNIPFNWRDLRLG